VQDEGLGLMPQQRGCVLPLEAHAPVGRGLFLIHHCFDDVRWSRRGNRVQVSARRIGWAPWLGLNRLG
jgi:anti-sigma regulatory factor (Ser/Thr protein kinase)